TRCLSDWSSDVCSSDLQTLHQFDIAFPHGGENRCAEMTGQLDGHASNATAARVNQHALVCAQLSDLHQSLPRRQRNQRKGGGFFERQVGGFEGGGAIADCCEFRERSNSVAVHS